MEIKAHFNFIKGKTAEFLKESLELEFSAFRNIELKPLKGISANKVEFDNKGFAIHKDGENEYLMFYYLPSFKVGLWKSLPKFHVCQCVTRNSYTGFVFSNKMPVDIYSKDERKTYKGQNLSLCKNCSRQVFKSWWGSSRPWYDSMLDYVQNQDNPTFNKDGYHSMWSQITDTYREKRNWTCENHNCKIDLSAIQDQRYLHTHHVNGNTKDNRTKNFQALCLLCHSLEHKNKLKSGTGFMEVDSFIAKYKSRLSSNRLKEYERIKK
jgi:hypothetical protein